MGYRHRRTDCESTCLAVETSSLTLRQAYYWVETKGTTIEEIDALFDGEKHSSVPDVELVRTGKEKLDLKQVEEELTTEIISAKSE